MHFDDVPDDIVVAALARATRHPEERFMHFGRSLSLLAVCRRWRRLALPIVYSRVTFEYDDMPESASEDTDANGLRIVSNLDLAVSAGCTGLVREVWCTAFHMDDALPGLETIVSRMKRAAARWARVDTLWVISHSDSHGTSNDDNPDAVTQSIAEGLIEMLPGVRRLKTDCDSGDVAIGGVSALLVNGYAAQLCSYNGRLASLALGCVFKQLERATVSFGSGTGVRPPVIDTGRLQHLELEGVPLACSWGAFAGSDSGVGFPELVSLMVDYDASDPGDTARNSLRLHFPQLRAARVSCSADMCPWLQQAMLPARMARLDLCLSAAAFSSLEEVDIPALERLAVVIHNIPDPDDLAFVGRFLSRARACKAKELSLCDRQVVIVPDFVSCVDLTALKVDAPASIDTVVLLAERLQQLQRLAFTDIKPSGVQVDISAHPPDAHAPLVPLNTSLQVLLLKFGGECGDWDMLAATTHLLARLPSLTKLIAFDVPTRPVLDFAQGYSALYPHLGHADSVFYGHY
ncbi:hypothetical protein H4R19_000461 [Coemansia spiralis]|nr:hypothetical protein H4R19_000461 [Coemansia spiralis]